MVFLFDQFKCVNYVIFSKNYITFLDAKSVNFVIDLITLNIVTMITVKTKTKRKIETANTKIVVANNISNEIQNRKTFFEHALANLNNNPFRIVMV